MNYKMLINKNNPLPKTYIPKNLINANSKYKDNIYINQEVLSKFKLMQQDALKKGYQIDIMSGYRDYEYQEKIYNKQLKEKGYANTFRKIAKPGTSEHQTGLAIDICIYKDNKCYIEHELENTKELEWLEKNTYKYGFVLRYPKEKEDITGYDYEPWHYRFVANLSHILYKNNLTLEEYYNLNPIK